MILAAYMVVGFLVASIYAVGMLRGRRDRLHRLGLLIPLTIACIATPIQLFVGDTAAREVADHQPAKFAGMECIQEERRRPDRVHRRHLHEQRRQGVDPDPRPRLLPGRLQQEHRRDRPQRRSPPTNARRPTRCCTSPSTRWSGSAARCCCSASGSPGPGGGGATSRARPGSCARSRSPASARSSPSGSAGSSPRSAASPGSCRATCAPPKRSPRRRGSGSPSPAC